jgi:disulfide bond formation protein DsbB
MSARWTALRVSVTTSSETVTTMHHFFAVLAVGAAVLALAVVALRLAGRRDLLTALSPVALPLGAVMATTATLGSLFFSEWGVHWEPCRFCWFQRVFMYPAAVLLIVASVRRDRAGAARYVVPLCAIGLLLSSYHILLEQGVVSESSACSISCAVPYFKSFGVTLAMMAWAGFAAIIAVLTLVPDDTADDQLETPLDELAEEHR